MDIKKRLAMVCFVCCLILSGCSIGGEVYEKTPHLSEEQQGQIPQDMVVVTTYSSIKNTLQEMIYSAAPSVKLAVVDYWGDIDTDIKDIIMQLTTEDPVGSYAVSSIVYEQAKTMSYHQFSLSIQYKKTEQEIKSIINVKSSEDFEAHLCDMFATFKTKQVFNVSVSETEDELMEMAYKAYYNSPVTAVGLKSIKFSQIRDTRMNQIVEVEIGYLYRKPELVRMGNEILAAAESILAEQYDKTTDEKIQFIYDYLNAIPVDAESMIVVAETNNTQPKTEQYSAYGALISGKTAQSGIALTAKLFCDILEVPSFIISGERDDVPHLWLAVDRGDVWQHFDVSNAEGNYIISSIDLAQHYNYNFNLYRIA